MKGSGDRNAKLDKHDFHGIFLGFTATDQNIIYLDLDTGIVKQSHHPTFDEAWYLQPSHPSVAQLLYDLGLEAESIPISSTGPLLDDSVGSQRISTIPLAPWPPPCPVSHMACKWAVPPCSQMLPLPLCETELPHPLTAAAARVRVCNPVALEFATEYDITHGDLVMVHMSPDPFFGAFEEDINLCKWSYDAGMALVEHNGRLYLGNMIPGLPGAKVDKWRLYLRGAWLIQVGHTPVSTIAEANRAFKGLYDKGANSVTLLFSHPELRRDISNKGLPIISSPPYTQLTHDQLNHC